MAIPRFEHKFRINEVTAAAVRDYISAFLQPDTHVADAATGSYPVNSLYFDSDDLRTVRSAISGSRRRYKLRVRTYDDRANSPVFFEVKHRINGQIVKERGAVHRAAYEEILFGRNPMLSDLYFENPRDIDVIEHFLTLRREIDAQPKAHVRYSREAWVSTAGCNTRVTMDRNVCVTPRLDTQFLAAEMDEPTRPFGDMVVLEVKFSGTPPPWFGDLARVTGIRRTSAAKYCDAVLVRGENEFSPRYAPPTDRFESRKLENRRRRLEWCDTGHALGSLEQAVA